ncbi:MAG: hypothetical protein ACJAWV_001707 [Flammeovirgaceae bacterium]|jgi:hypothetical protein
MNTETFIKGIKLPPVIKPIRGMLWDCRVYRLADKQYIAKILVYDEYHGWLAKWETHKISPTFKSVSGAEVYALKKLAQ